MYVRSAVRLYDGLFTLANNADADAEERVKEETFWANFERSVNRNKRSSALIVRTREEMREMDLLCLNVKDGDVGLKITPDPAVAPLLIVEAQTQAKEKDNIITGGSPQPRLVVASS